MLDVPARRHTDRWSTRLTFILAATGSAVGLGNIWKFPYITGEYGGGAFVLVYLLCIALVGLPLMMAEVLIGRRGHSSPVASIEQLAMASGHGGQWRWIGSMGAAGSFLILSFYSVVGGWALAYLWHALGNAFAGQNAETINALFDSLLASPDIMLFWHTLFMALVVGVVIRGISRGIEKAVTVLMPAMFVILLVMLGYTALSSDFAAGFHFLFDADFSKLSREGVLVALGHAFFTLSLGMAVMIAYGSYLPQSVSIFQAAVTVSILDTAVALMAGLVIFPIVFANGLEPGAGPGLIFQTVPLAFGQMTAGGILAVLFFFLLVFAAWSSGLSLLEPVVERLEERLDCNRALATLVGGGAAWGLGIFSVLSFNRLKDFHPLDGVPLFDGKTVFDILDTLTANLMMPINGLLIAIFCGWVLSRSASREELGDGTVFRIWYFLVRYVSPACVLAVFGHLLGWY